MQRPESNRTLLGAVLASFVFTIFTTAQAQVWREYVSEKGKFSVLLPGAPTIGYRPGYAELDAAVVYVTNLQKNAKAWQIAYFDLPAAPPDAVAVKKLLELLRDKNSPRTKDTKALSISGGYRRP